MEEADSAQARQTDIANREERDPSPRRNEAAARDAYAMVERECPRGGSLRRLCTAGLRVQPGMSRFQLNRRRDD